MAEPKPSRRIARKAKAKAADLVDKAPQPSPNPMTNLVLADLALRGGTRLLRHLVERSLLSTKYAPGKARAIVNGRTMSQTLVSTALVRIATRSVPGALVVGGGLLAKTLYDRRQDKAKARRKGKAAVDKQAEKGGFESADA